MALRYARGVARGFPIVCFQLGDHHRAGARVGVGRGWLVPAEPMKVARIFKCGLPVAQGGSRPGGTVEGCGWWDGKSGQPPRWGGWRARSETRI